MTSSTPTSLASPFAIGGVIVPNRVILAPMAGMTNSAFRRRAKAHGAGLVVTEMVSANGLLYGNVATARYLDFLEEERPIAVQLFTADPNALRRAVEVCLERDLRPDLIDLNMGCPVRKVMKTGAGAALLADPRAAAELAHVAVEAAAQAGVPVTVKIRSGLAPDRIVAVETACRLEAVGVAAIGVHPRTASQLYRGRADHSVTAEVAVAVQVPVLASGDVTSVAAAAQILAESAAVAVMVARGAQRGPWLVADLVYGVERPRPELPAVTVELRELLRLAAADMGPRRALGWMRKIVGWYLKGSGVSAARVDGLRSAVDVGALDTALALLTEDG
ncbi:MAG: tRNA dihydrouridine synthase [Thermoleophilia bacterium]